MQPRGSTSASVICSTVYETDFEGHLTNSKWAQIEKCSADTALRDITDLLEKGILQKAAGGGRSTNYSIVQDTHSLLS